jgi:hypothetical protein
MALKQYKWLHQNKENMYSIVCEGILLLIKRFKNLCIAFAKGLYMVSSANTLVIRGK